jgi:putative transcriptional regulator
MIVIIVLKKLREQAGLSQNELARKTGYSPQFIQKIEQGKAKSITLEAAARFCEALGCKPGDLLEEEPDLNDPTTTTDGTNLMRINQTKRSRAKGDLKTVNPSDNQEAA